MVWLTKSRFLSGLQCHKRLWFEVHQPLEEPPEAGMPVLQGRVFDEVVQRLRPGTTISRDEGTAAAIAETAALLARGSDAPATLYQPAFRAGDLAVIADVLRRRSDQYDLVEVKATTQVKDIHIPDAAFQTLVLRRTGMPINRIFIGHVNNRFVLEHAGDLDGLLVEEDITNEVEARLQEVGALAPRLQQAMASSTMPSIGMGPQCHQPYECPFISRCSAGSTFPDFPIENLPNGGRMVEALRSEGYRDLRDVPKARLTSPMHRRVHEAILTGTAFFDASAADGLRQYPMPYTYLDFETINPVVPEIIGTRPYQQIPFQWSVHVEASRTEIRHEEYLAIESFGDLDALAMKLLAAIAPEGPIFAYNAKFEKSVLDGLANLLPGRVRELGSLASRLVDLLPITRNAYYHRDMQGSWSIKHVIPTIRADLGHDRLDVVQEGGAAQLAFLKLRDPRTTPEQARQLRNALLRYCEHDTWVLVILRRFLCGEPF